MVGLIDCAVRFDVKMVADTRPAALLNMILGDVLEWNGSGRGAMVNAQVRDLAELASGIFQGRVLRELIHDIIFDSDLANDLADSWRAMIVLVTDGNHNIRRPDGRPEGDRNVIEEIEDIDTGSEKLIDGKIAVGCVGIGSDLNMNLLSKIASPCTTDQLDNAAKMGVAKYLENGCLLLKVDERKPNFGTVIRSFVDMMSGST